MTVGLVNWRIVDCKRISEGSVRYKSELRTDLPRLDVRPLVSLHVHTERSQSGEENDGLEARLLPLVVLGLRCPAQESNDVLGHLRRRSRRAYIRQKRGKCSFM